MTARTIAAAALLAVFLAACGGPAAAPAPTTAAPTTAAPTPAPTATPAPAPAAGSLAFTVTQGSKATVRVRETLAGFSAPNDAVLETGAVTGSFTLQPDGTFAAGSKITVDLTTLASDSRQRDNFIKNETLETRQFPIAEFTPKRAVGLALPLPSGDLTFKVEGTMRVHGTDKDVVFDVKATRTGAEVKATAVADPPFKFADFAMRIPRVASVLSIVDEIRLEVELAARQR